MYEIKLVGPARSKSARLRVKPASQDESFTDRSDYNNLIDELGLIENEVEVSDKEARNSNVIISELESAGLDFRKKVM